jgi:hypothetical protein
MMCIGCCHMLFLYLLTLGISLGVVLLDHMADLFLVF